MTDYITQPYSQYLFPAQIAIADIKDFFTFQQDLINWIYEYQKVDYGTMISNRGGYQSESKEIFLEESFIPYKNKIMPAINELVKEFNIIRPVEIVQMWVNVNGQYCYNTSHKHAGVDLSGVLWINQNEESGVFVFENNETGLQTVALNAATKWEHSQSYNINSEFVPKYKDGTLCIFPAYLSHRVEINPTNFNRISISFNIKII